MGNLIVDGSGWPPCWTGNWSIGERYQDLAWFCIRAWRFGAPASLAAGGLGSVDDFVAAYENAGGSPRIAPPCVVAGARHAGLGRHLPVPGATGICPGRPSVGWRPIGRRVCETSGICSTCWRIRRR